MLAFILHWKYLESKKLFKFYFSLCCSLYFGFKFNLINSLKKCPECYGDDLCPFFQTHQIELTWFSFFLSIINPNWTKSVFHGVFNGTEVVIKRKSGRFSVEDVDKPQNVIFCPSVRDLNFLFAPVEKTENRRMLLDIKSSIEPLLLMNFKSQGNWPVPKYKGACGDLIVEDYKGEPLSKFKFVAFDKRMLLAIQLLKLADLFTFGHPDFAFYFTDYSLENLVVDLNGEVFLVDLDNVIISNRSGGNNSSKTIHTSEILNDLEYAFSPTDICTYDISDHNYFSVCKYLLTHSEDGLLTDVSNGELLQLLNECSEPKVMADRFSAGQKLQFVLESFAINKDIKW